MYNIIILIVFITLTYIIKQERNIKICTSLYCLLSFIINIFYSNTCDLFTKSFAIAIPFICFICSLWIFNKTIYKTKVFCINLILFCFLTIETFTQNNIFIMYACMEMSLIPMSIMLLSYYKSYNLNIVYKYLFYALISAIFILIGLIGIYNDTGCVISQDIYKKGIENKLPLYMLAIGTAIKLPTFPFYYWVPCVHGKAPGICSVLLSSIVLKFSALILVKVILPLYNIYSYQYIEYLVAIGILISVCQALCNNDLKTVLAYSSVIHMGLYSFILLSGNDIKYFTYSMLYHTFSMALSFLILDLLRNNYNCLDFIKLTINKKSEIIFLTASTLVITDFPFTWGFIVETMSILSLIKCNMIIASIAGLALLLYNSYLVYINFVLFRNSVIGNNDKVNIWYITIIYVVLLPIILLGIIPKIFL